ncbi:hypothetical protein K470DRAFT_268490 [Piedraia hortae CBS 480.64]|uniref:Elongation of fatty acids protein n=1 Tax=Piedraia hortae CBS 480.64 TaxID=1314780 RepID=A0A6A7C778_9PEZI|nr:hypothetical protein K470DRAFT_268490 [Piedraia hortae CBS 480.64]
MSIHFTRPEAPKLPPDPLPPVLPPPVGDGSLRAPFSIDAKIYNDALRFEVPLIFVIVYLVLVLAFSYYNKKRDHQPWRMSRCKAFSWFVLAHNLILAIFSAVTFYAMVGTMSRIWPGWDDVTPARMADALCKLHGPRGLGDAATFNSTTNIWEVKNTAIRLAYEGTPDSTDVGRLWNEGLAFWGWLFYLSKYWEVLDTLIILAKGKEVDELHGFHHAGAIMSMWAGMRYMGPPIWIFTVFNSAIHAIMYGYYIYTSLGNSVRPALKRTLTTLQITQFIIGASIAAIHLFIEYDIPVSTSYQIKTTIREAIKSLSSEISHIAAPTATAAANAFFKKMMLRAVGEEGVAERMAEPEGFMDPIIKQEIQQFNERVQYETKWRSEWQRVKCIGTSGEAFAVYLNLFYLLPLTALFVSFFYRSYFRGGNNAKDASRQAAVKTRQAINRAGEKTEEKVAKGGSKLVEKSGRVWDEFQEDLNKTKAEIDAAKGPVKDKVNAFERKSRESIGGSRPSSPWRGNNSQGDSSNKENRAVTEDDASKSTGGPAKSDKTDEPVLVQDRNIEASKVVRSSDMEQQNPEQDAKTQDRNLEKSQNLRPAPEDDPMMKSGSIIDLGAEVSPSASPSSKKKHKKNKK